MLIEQSITRKLPTVVRSVLENMPVIAQQHFVDEYKRKRKSLAGAYFASLLYCHYAYMGNVGFTFLMFFVAICTFGVGGVLWWIIDLFRMPGMISRRNADIAVEVLRDQKVLTLG